MSQPNFTPGPWRVAEEHRGAVHVYGRSCDPFDDKPLTDRDTYICAVQKGRWIYEQAANARLIAAAPALYEACKKALTCASLNSDVRTLIDDALALVEKP